MVKEIKIGAIWWKVVEVPAGKIDDDNLTIGNQCEQTQIIKIDESLSPEMKQQVLLHEIIHCVSGQLDHNTVEMLANQLYQVFSENKIRF